MACIRKYLMQTEMLDILNFVLPQQYFRHHWKIQSNFTETSLPAATLYYCLLGQNRNWVLDVQKTYWNL